jgi:hypothetical protein
VVKGPDLKSGVFSRAGSNPAGDVLFFFKLFQAEPEPKLVEKVKKKSLLPGLEPGLSDSESEVITTTL